MNENYVINLGRQLGSGGKEIGEKLAKEFGIAFYDKELIKLASDESGLCKEFFEKADERASQSIIGGLFGTRFPFISDGAIPYGSCLSNDSLFKIQSDVIRELAERQSCLFVGRCADYILRDHPRCVNVFVSASKEARIERLMRIHNIPSEAAEELMEKADKKRSSYYNYYSYKTWGAAETYHLCIDSSVLGIDGTVQFIKEFVKLNTQKDLGKYVQTKPTVTALEVMHKANCFRARFARPKTAKYWRFIPSTANEEFTGLQPITVILLFQILIKCILGAYRFFIRILFQHIL